MKTTASSRLVAGALLIGAVSPALAQSQTVQVRLNDQPLALSAAPLQVNGRTLLPMRDVFESLGASVNWNPAAQSIAAQAGATQIQFGINQRVAYVNGRSVSLDQPAILVGGRAFVPLRFVAQATGARVDWNAPLRLVSISKPLIGSSTRVADYLGEDVAPQDNTNRPNFRSIAVPRDVVVPVQLDRAISSNNSRVGDRFTATVVSHRMGDSEFPAGTKLEGLITEARPSEGKNPGVLDFAFQSAILPDGARVPLRARLISFDSGSVSSSRGRLVAKGARKNNDLASAGIGAGAGFVLGRVLGTDSTLSTALGGAGGYLFGRSRDRKAQEARLAANTTLGVRMLDAVRYRDSNGYASLRDTFLNGPSRAFDPRSYDANTPAYDAPRDGYDNTPVRDSLPAPAPLPEDRYANGNAPDYRFDGNNNANGADPYANGTGNYVNGDSLAQSISVPDGAVIPLRLDRAFSSATARVGDPVSATVDSERLGDSEFPAGTRILGQVVEARPRTNRQPGVLDFDFQTAQLPSGERVPLRGELISLDDKGVQPIGGRLVATGRRNGNDRAKVIGIGAVGGFVVGRVLGKNGVLPSALGALGGYLYGEKSNRNRTNEAVVPRNARLGLRLNDGLRYNGGTYYASRAQYLRQR